MQVDQEPFDSIPVRLAAAEVRADAVSRGIGNTRYPFVLSGAVVRKRIWVHHRVIRKETGRNRAAGGPARPRLLGRG